MPSFVLGQDNNPSMVDDDTPRGCPKPPCLMQEEVAFVVRQKNATERRRGEELQSDHAPALAQTPVR